MYVAVAIHRAIDLIRLDETNALCRLLLFSFLCFLAADARPVAWSIARPVARADNYRRIIIDELIVRAIYERRLESSIGIFHAIVECAVHYRLLISLMADDGR